MYIFGLISSKNNAIYNVIQTIKNINIWSQCSLHSLLCPQNFYFFYATFSNKRPSRPKGWKRTKMHFKPHPYVNPRLDVASKFAIWSILSVYDFPCTMSSDCWHRLTNACEVSSSKKPVMPSVLKRVRGLKWALHLRAWLRYCYQYSTPSFAVAAHTQTHTHWERGQS